MELARTFDTSLHGAAHVCLRLERSRSVETNVGVRGRRLTAAVDVPESIPDAAICCMVLAHADGRSHIAVELEFAVYAPHKVEVVDDAAALDLSP